MRFKMLATAVAALSVVATPVLAQVTPTARSSNAMAANDEIPAGNTVIALIAVAAFAAGLYIVVSDEDEDDLPTSP